MTHTDYTRNILNIKDPNIIFDENCLEEKTTDKVTYKVFHGKLTYTPSLCPNCGCIYENNPDTIIKYGFKKNCKIKMDKLSNYSTILLLDKQRFFCKHCKSTFIATSDLVDFHKQISNNTKMSITLELMHKSSEKDIARRNNVSSSTVNRILDSISEDKIIKNNGKLPEVIGIDEFKATKDTISKMAFIITLQNKKNIFDINNSRFSNDIKQYFMRYQKKDRDNVKFITMDLYKPYYGLMSSLFKNATIVPDRFHIIIQVRNALDLTRIKLCTKSNPNYTKLKKYWKLILKDKRELVKDKRRIRVVNIHNNLSLEHYIKSDKPYLISWEKSKIDNPIYDLYNLYLNHYLDFDFNELFINYESKYPLLNEERILLFSLLTIPWKFEFNDTEYNLCKNARKLFDYLYKTEKLVTEYKYQKPNME